MRVPLKNQQTTQHADGALGHVIAFALARPVAIAMLVIAVSVVGAMAYVRIPVQLMPSGYTFPMLYVQVVWPNATPAEGARQVLEPLESAVATVPGVRRMSGSASAGSLGMRIEFDDDTDMDDAYNGIRERIDRLRSTLPSTIEGVFIYKFDPDSDPIVVAGLLTPDGVGDAFQRVERRIVPRLDRIPGVGSVELWGGAPRIVEVAVDADRALALGFTPYGIAESIRRAGFVIAAGRAQQSGRIYPLRVSQPLQGLESLRNLSLRQDVRVADVANVQQIFDETQGSYTRIDGRRSLIIAAYKESRANTVDTAALVRKTLQELVSNDPSLKGFAVEPLFDQGEVIAESIAQLESALMFGGFIAVLLLFLFLGHVRLTLVAATAIPASLLASMASLYLLGRTLNLLSLMGLMLSVGMVVDNAIVVVERVARWRRQNVQGYEAARRGTQEVALAITVATGTTIVAFLPVILLSGERSLRFFLGELGLPVCISLAASLVMAVLVVPLMSTWGGTAEDRGPGLLSRAANIFVEGYAKALNYTLRHPLNAVLVAIALLLSTKLAEVPRTDQMMSGGDQVVLVFHMPTQFTEAERTRVLETVEQTLNAHARELEIEHVIMRVARQRGRDYVRAYLRDASERDLAQEEISRRIKKIVDPGPGVRWQVGWGGASGAQDKSLAMTVRGPDSEVLRNLAAAIVQRAQRVDGVIGVEADVENDAIRELRASLRPDASMRQQLNPALLGGSLALAVRGIKVGRVRIGGQDLDVLVRVADAAKTGSKGLATLSVPLRLGSDVTSAETLNVDPAGGVDVDDNRAAVGAIAQFIEAPGFGVVYREDRETVVQIQASLERADIEKVREEMISAMADIPMPRGYRVSFGSRFEDLEEMKTDELFAVGLAVALVFLFMGMLFESWLLPLVVLTSIPFAYTGAMWTLAITSTPRDVMSMVGMVILVGIVVNNAIVLVDAMNRARLDGADMFTAVLNSGRERLRPIMMTALTTVGGLLPLAMGTVEIAGVSYAPLARTVIGGLVASTMVTLVFVPLTYTLFSNLGHVLTAAWQHAVAGKSSR